jgi:hypothetical protein
MPRNFQSWVLSLVVSVAALLAASSSGRADCYLNCEWEWVSNKNECYFAGGDVAGCYRWANLTFSNCNRTCWFNRVPPIRRRDRRH